MSCAKVGTLTGGQKDTQPPRIDTLRSTPNRQVNFSKKEIKITFDEWVKLDRPAEQILLSPPLAQKPIVSLKGKSVTVQLPENEPLKANTTYTLNFGNAVQDFHEGNPFTGLRYVFSTGPVIDSLEIKGLVADAFTGQPVEAATVLLYALPDSTALSDSTDSTNSTNLASWLPVDSLIKKGRPDQFARTDKAGQFSLENLRGGRYRLAAIDDQNLNYRLDAGERAAFFEKEIGLPDSSADLARMRIFKNDAPLRLMSSESKSFGLARLFFNENASGIRPDSVRNPPQLIDYEEFGDSTHLWYDGTAGAFALFFGKDSAVVKPPDRAAFFKKQPLAFIDDARPVAPKTGRGGGRGGGAPREKFGGQQPAPTAPGQPKTNQPTTEFQTAKTIQQNPRRPLELVFNRPVAGIDTALVRWADDSSRVFFLKNQLLKADTLSKRKWLLDGRWPGGRPLRLTLLPGALTDIFGEKNRDTLRRVVSVLSEKQLGSLNVTFKNLDTGKGYLFELLSGEAVVERRAFQPKEGGDRFAFPALPVGQFSGRLTEDSNKNGRWDSGSFELKRQPEVIFTQKFDDLKAEWEQEVEFAPGGGQRERPGGKKGGLRRDE